MKTKTQFPKTNPFAGKNKAEAQKLKKLLFMQFHPDKHAHKGKAAEKAAEEKFKQLEDWYRAYKGGNSAYSSSSGSGSTTYTYKYDGRHRSKQKPQKRAFIVGLFGLHDWFAVEKHEFSSYSGLVWFFRLCERNFGLLLLVVIPFFIFFSEWASNLSAEQEEEAVKSILGLFVGLASILIFKMFK